MKLFVAVLILYIFFDVDLLVMQIYFILTHISQD